jgi:hypothetical protein
MNQLQLKDHYRYDDGELIRLQSRGGSSAGEFAGWITHCNKKPYKKMSFNKKTLYVHHVIFFMHYGYLPKYIDHADGNSLNNKIENLRPATQSQNLANSCAKKTNTSGYKGVTYRKDTEKWQAAIMVNGKHISLGSYSTKEKAALAYKNGSEKYFEEFANQRLEGKSVL